MSEAQQLQQATESVRTLHKALRDSQKKNEQLTRDLARLQTTIVEPQAANDHLRQELQEAQQEVEEKQGTIEQLTQDLDHQGHEPQQYAPESSKRRSAVKELQDMKAPEKTFRGSAVSESNIAFFNGRNSQKIHSYDSDTQKWDQQHIPDTPYIKHTLVIVKNRLTIVGGFLNGRATNSIRSLTGEGMDREWLELFPAMPSHRLNTTAICSGHSLIVAGGYDLFHILTTVEVMNTETLQWFTASPLPHPFSSATASVCGDNLYMLGGVERPNQPTRLVLTCSVSKLLDSCQPQPQPQPQPLEVAIRPAVWQRVADSPYYLSSCAAVYRQLVLVGGLKFNEAIRTGEETTAVSTGAETTAISTEPKTTAISTGAETIANTTQEETTTIRTGAGTTDISTYNASNNSWQVIGNSPTAQYRALVVMIRDKMMVVGGLDASLSPQRVKFDPFFGAPMDAVNNFTFQAVSLKML